MSANQNDSRVRWNFWGGTEFSHYNAHYGIGTALFSYWSRSLDSYTQLQSIVDEKIGQVIDALPEDVTTPARTDFSIGKSAIFTKKPTTCLSSSWTRRVASPPQPKYPGMDSSVDLLRRLVDVGNHGSNDWMKLSTEVELYNYTTHGGRLELDNVAGGLFTTLGVQTLFDQIVPNVLRAPLPESLAEVSSEAMKHYVRYEALARIEPPKSADGQPTHPFGGAF